MLSDTGLAKVNGTESQDVKRIRVAPGKFVTISSELAEKAARMSAISLTRDQVLEFKASEPKRVNGLMAGSPKPLTIAKPRR